MNNNLIFDLGFLDGTDSKNYLDKGYKVIAVEANPDLVEQAFIGRLKWESFDGKNHVLIPNAIYNESNIPFVFYINKERPEVSSLEKWIASQNGKFEVEEKKVYSISLQDLIKNYGVPYYIKVDVEGVDKIVAKQIYELEEKPMYVSFELNKDDFIDIFYYMKKSGYTKYKLVNQLNNLKNSSGDFGKYLENWLDYNTAFSNYCKYRELKIIDNVNLGLGWIDLHCGR